MDMVLAVLKRKIDPICEQELSELSKIMGLPIDNILELLLEKSSYTLASLHRMTTERLELVTSSPTMLSEIKRLIWKQRWAMQTEAYAS